MAARKRIERFYLDLARKWYSEFPAGEILECESPDFLLRSTNFCLGIEVTRLFQDVSDSIFAPKQIESFRKEVIQRANEIYTAYDYPALDVNVYFSSPSSQRQDKEHLASTIAEFVRLHRPNNNEIRNFHTGHPTILPPRGIDSMSVAHSLPGSPNRWYDGAVGTTVSLTYERLAQIISKKSARVDQYRDRAPTVWLLIVTDLFPPSANFSVPGKIYAWRFRCEFDLVLLLSREESKVWAFSRV